MAHPLVEIAYNPLSGGHAPHRIDALRAAFETRGATVRVTTVADQRFEIDAGTTCLCVAGGDGTVRQAVQAVQRTGREIVIGIYPTGTVNLIAIEAGLGTDADALADRLLGEVRHRSYSVSLNDTQFTVCASVSPETWAVERVSLRLKGRIGRFAYAVAVLPSLIAWPRRTIRIAVDGRRLNCEAFYVAKGRYFAGRWVLAPDARLGTSDMRLVVLKTARRIDMARFWLRLATRRPVDDLAFVETITCTAFSAEAEGALAIQADGDIVATLPGRFALIQAPVYFA